MKLRTFGLSLVAVAGMATAVTIRLSAQPPAPPQPAPAAAHDGPRLQGVGGCAAAGCHNDQGPAGSPGSEYGAWVYDRHGRANETVQSPKYRAVLERLKGTVYTEELCLKCHATPTADGSPLPRDLLAEGVGCESCHGASEHWRTIHYQGQWKGLTATQKEQYGLFPTKDLTRRIEKCAECHVGNLDKDVNHDLIAAGHPRLTFEFSAYHHLMPRHWREPHEQVPPAANARPDFEAHAWALGQAVVAKVTVELLAGRAKAAEDRQPTHPWPEFAEYGCFACHHRLGPDGEGIDSWRQKRGFAGGRPGEWLWGTWVKPATDALARYAPGSLPVQDGLFAELDTLMRKPVPAADQVRTASKQALDRLDGCLKRLRDAEPLSATQVRERLNALVGDALKQDAARWPRDWDEAAQHYLAVAALYSALGSLDAAAATPQRRASFAELRKVLKFPSDPGRGLRFDSPVDFRPETYRQSLQRFWSAFESGTAP